jgi:hypothetical protein
MTKKLLAKVGTYTNQQGETKNDYCKLGVVMQGQNGEFMLLDPSVNLAGVLIKQNTMAVAEGKQQRDSVMVSVFDGDNQQPGRFQQPQQQFQPQQQQGFTPQQPQQSQQQSQAEQVPFDDDVPFAPLCKQYRQLHHCI